ncbi:MAG: hypothetical protein OXC40_04125 [Proteobacteria bacterium]|nr:hypothetical protein [Pseudomonadota bacterium]
MKGFTGEYYQLFIEAKSCFNEEELKADLCGDVSDYKTTYDEIEKTLHDPSGMGIDSHHTRLQLVIEEKLSRKLSEEINESLRVFQAIRDAVKGKVFEFDNKSRWIKAIQLALLYYTHRKMKTDHGLPSEYEFIASSLAYLKDKGFSIESVDGHINPNDAEMVRLFTAIEYRVKRLGRNGFFIFMSAMYKHYSVVDQRFFFYRNRSPMPTAQKPMPPHGYVFNLFCKNLDSSKKLKAKEQYKLLEEVQYLSTHLATILGLDKMSPYANMYVDSENILQRLSEWVLYPEVYYIPQLSPVHSGKMFPRIFELVKNNSEQCLSETLKASKVLEKIEDWVFQQGAIAGEITEREILDLCVGIDTRDNLVGIINSLSRPAAEINKGYVSPFDAQKSNIREVPLIKSRTGYVVANVATYNMAKYRALLNIADKFDPKIEQKLGFALEDFVKENFDGSSIDYHHSFKYSVPDYVREISNTRRDQGECDFVIECDEYVYLVEVKKKGLTKESQSGSSLHLLRDTALSFLKSINQLTVAELILLTEGKLICSSSGEIVELAGRDVFKLVISLEDMASLQSDNIKSSLLHGLYNIRINVSDNAADDIADKINKELDEFALMQAELMKKDEKYKHSPFHCVSYLSTPQLLTILDDVDNNEDFSHNIYRSNSVVYSLMDWYASYKMAKESKLLKENRRVFKNTVLIN